MPYFGIPIRNGLPIGLGSVAGFGVQQFSPADLFSAGEQGAWYDPSDLTTLFTDSAGTTPVTGVEQFVGRMNDKSGRGNHATQTTSAKRPKLAARYNLLTYSEQFDNAVWSTVVGIANFGSGSVANTTATTDPLGGNTADLITTATTNSHYINSNNNITVINGAVYTFSVYLKKGSGVNAPDWITVFFNAAGFGVTYVAAFNITTVQAGSVGAGVSNPTIQSVGNGWVRCSITATATSTTSSSGVGVGFNNNANTASLPSYAANSGENVFIWGADLRPASQATGLIGPTYQRVVDAATYDTAGFLPYLQFDGLDDSMSTNSIDFSAGDKMTVWAGVRKLSDANTGTVAQLSPSTSTNNGVFGLYVPFNTGASADYAWQSKGTIRITVNSSVSTGPATSVFTAIGNISAPLAQLRQNAIQIATSSASQGTGNFGNFALNIGEGAGFLNGWLTSLIVRGAQSTQGQIEATESWVNGKTGAF
jgi:hypothetical protein